MNRYQILIYPQTEQHIRKYLSDLQAEHATAGSYLNKLLQGHQLSQLSFPQFVELLLNTKRPKIFAESAVFGDGTDWNPTELSLLGDIGIAVPVTVFDNGLHRQPAIHAHPFNATLLYLPGALLQNGRGQTAADWNAVTENGRFSPTKYAALYERRLLPSLLYASQTAQASGQQAFITLPGLGCGLFAGPFRGQLGEQLKLAVMQLLQKYYGELGGITAVYYDPYSEGQNERHPFGHLSLLVRPLLQGNQHKPQLCPPTHYAEAGDDFSNAQLFSFVAWDHVSWPGNDFYIGARATDDGVKAAATSSMAVMTAVQGSYQPSSFSYEPPAPHKTWLDVIQANNLKLIVNNNLHILPPQPSP